MPEEIYGEDVEVNINMTSKLRGWHPDIGMAIDGENPDLGTVNGTYPITEGMRARYLIPLLMLIIDESKVLSQEYIAKGDTAFIDDDKRRACVFYEKAWRLNPHNSEIFAKLTQTHEALGNTRRATICREQWAALTIQNAWDKKGAA